MKTILAIIFTLYLCTSAFAQGYRYIPAPPTGGPWYAPPVVYVVPYQYYYSIPTYRHCQPQPYYHGYLPYHNNYQYHVWIRP